MNEIDYNSVSKVVVNEKKQRDMSSGQENKEHNLTRSKSKFGDKFNRKFSGRGKFEGRSSSRFEGEGRFEKASGNRFKSEAGKRFGGNKFKSQENSTGRRFRGEGASSGNEFARRSGSRFEGEGRFEKASGNRFKSENINRNFESQKNNINDNQQDSEKSMNNRSGFRGEVFFINNDFTKKVQEPCKVEELSDNMDWYKE